MNPLIILLPPLFAVAVYTEVKDHRIPNRLTLTVMVCALLGAVLVGGLEGGGNSLLGLLIGAGVFLPFCLMGAVGGGDLKLMGAAGAVLGFPEVLWALYYTCLAGGVLALLYMIWSGRMVDGFVKMFRLMTGRRKERGPGLRKATTIPYGLAIAAGSIWSLIG